MDFFLIWVFPALMLGGLGLILLLGTMKHINRCKAVAGWSKTKGTVDSASVEAHRSQRFNRTLRTGYNSTHYEPKIAYSYSVMGSIFHASAYQNFNGIFHDTSEDHTAEIVAAYPPGKSVTVTFDPDNPADAYLLPETDTSRLVERRMIQIVMIAIAVVWFSLGFGINILGKMKAEYAQKQIEQSAGVLPITPDQLEPGLNSLIAEYGLTCSVEGYSGKTLAYKENRCTHDDVSNLTAIEVDARKEDIQKIDVISALSTPSDLDATITFYEQVSALVFDAEALGTVSEWIKATLPEVIETGNTVSASIVNLPLTMSNLGGVSGSPWVKHSNFVSII
jgi:hypothetical protein